MPGSFCRTFPVIGAAFGAANGRSAAAAEQSKGGDGAGRRDFSGKKIVVVFSKSVCEFCFLPEEFRNPIVKMTSKRNSILSTDLALLILKCTPNETW